jgi:hypothetical protein
VYGKIGAGCFLSCTARIQREMSHVFQEETDPSLAGSAGEVALLESQQQEYSARAAESLQEIAGTVRDFRQACAEMNRLSAGLEVTRIMGKVECARHTFVKERTDELLFELEAFQRTLVTTLKEIDNINIHICAEADDLIARSKLAA